MKKSILKIVTLLLVIGLNWAGFLAIGRTFAYFSDNENSLENIYQAGTLDFSLNNTNFDEGIKLNEKIFLSSVLTNAGTLPWQYIVIIEKTSGSDDFCNALELEAELNGIEKHDDSFMSFNVPVSTMLGSWSFEVRLPVTATNIPHGDTCEVDIVFKGWQTDAATYEDSGFSDEERIHLKFTSRMIVLNEFLPNPDESAWGMNFGEDDDLMPDGEWVELYNNSDVEYNLDGWYIWDASNDNSNKISITNLNTQPASTTISGKSWLVVYMNKEVLDNTGDTVKLFDEIDTLIDSYIYTGDSDYCEIEPTPGDENTTTTTGNCGGVPPNKSYARIPDGIGYWVDPIPTPGGPNIDDDNNYSLSQQQIEPKDDITFSELVEEFIGSGEIVEDLIEELEEIEEPMDIEVITELEISTVSEFPEDSIIETTTPSTEEVIVIEELIEEVLKEEQLIEEVSEETILEEEIVEEEAIIEEEPVIEEPVEESASEEVLIEDSQPEPLKEPDPEPEPEPKPEPEPDTESEPDPPEAESNNDEEENV